MDKIIEKLIEGNNKYQWKILDEKENIKIEGRIPRYPVLILSCMDPRIDVHRIFQLNLGDVFILRNAGNQYSEDMLRSILIAVHEYNVRYIIVLGHLDCGMKKVNLDELRNKISPDLLKQIGQYSVSFKFAVQKFFKTFVDEIINVNNQIEGLKKSKNLPPNVKVIGMIYDQNSGWVFNENEFSQYQFYDNFMKDYKEIIQNKKINLVDFLETIESEIVNKKRNLAEIPPVKSNKVKVMDREISLVDQKGKEDKAENLYAETKESIATSQNEFRLPELQKFMKFRVNVQTPKIHIPKIKVYVPSLNKSKEPIESNE